MAKRLLFITFLLASMLRIEAQPNLLWTTTDNFGLLQDATRDYSGNIITATLNTADSKWSVSLNKYSNVGAQIYQKAITTYGNLFGYQYKLTTDRAGNIYAAVEDANEKQLLIKYSSNGDSLWSQRYLLPPEIPEDEYSAEVKAIASDANGNICVVSILNIHDNNGSEVPHLLVTSYSSNGELLWFDKSILAGFITTATFYPDIDFRKMVIDSFNNIIISMSYRWSYLDLYETRTVKYAPGNGENLPQWDRSISKQPYGAPCNDLTVDNEGNIYVEYQNAGGFPFYGGIHKYSSNGSTVWEHGVKGNGNPVIAADNNGGVFVAYDVTTFTSKIGYIYHFNETDSSEFAQFSYPGNSSSSIKQLHVDEAGFVSASGITQLAWTSQNSKYLFIEFSPTGVQTGSAIYSSNENYFDIPTYLFEGNGTYTVVGFSENPADYSRINWISKINVVPNPPPPPDLEPEKGWALQAAGTTANLKSVWFKSGTEGWIVGDAGTILKTTNSGQEWTIVSSPVIDDFKEIKFFSDSLGFIIGAGSILRTGDFGNTWTKVSETGELTLYAITSNNNGTFVAVGSEGLGKYSTDFGLTWSNIASPTTGTLRDVEYLSDGFYAFSDFGEAYYTNTLDSWFQFSTALLGQSYHSSNVIDGKIYIYGTTLATINQNAEIINSIDFPPYPLNSVSDEPNADLILVCGDSGTIGFIEPEQTPRYKTVSQYNLNDIFQSGSFAVLVGDNGTILNFNNRTRVLENPQVLFNSITMINPQTFIYVSPNKLHRSVDGGNNWTIIDSSGTWSPTFHVNGNTVWGSKTIDSTYKIFLSTNAGLTWTDNSPSDVFLAAPQIATSNGKDVIVNSGRNGVDAMNVFYSSDFGKNWSLIDYIQPNVVSIYKFADLSTVWKANYDVSAKTFSLMKHNLNLTVWQTTYVDTTTDPLHDYDFYPVNEDEVILNAKLQDGQKMLSTINAGISWENYPLSIQSPKYIDGKSFINSSGLDFELSEDGNFSHQNTVDYFFNNNRASVEQKLFGDDQKLKWLEEGQIVFENPIPIDTTQTDNQWLYLTSTPSKIIKSNLMIPDTILVSIGSSDNIVKSINIVLDEILHPTIGNLSIAITHLGITKTIFHHSGFSANNIINVTLNDDSPRDFQYERPPFSGEYKPYTSLDAFLQTNPNGEWIIQIFDESVSDSGSLESWSLKLTTEKVTSVPSEEFVPTQFNLSQNYPNPFNPTTIINYRIPSESHVKIIIYDILGREVSTLLNKVVNAGNYSIPYNASSISSGVYMYRLEATTVNGSKNNFSQVKKMILLK